MRMIGFDEFIDHFEKNEIKLFRYRKNSLENDKIVTEPISVLEIEKLDGLKDEELSIGRSVLEKIKDLDISDFDEVVTYVESYLFVRGFHYNIKDKIASHYLSPKIFAYVFLAIPEEQHNKPTRTIVIKVGDNNHEQVCVKMEREKVKGFLKAANIIAAQSYGFPKGWPAPKFH